MQFYYEIFEGSTRVDTGVRIELVELKQGQTIHIYDNSKPDSQPEVIKDEDELLGWKEARARAYAWRDKVDRKKWNPMEETDGFHVKTPVDNNLKTAAAMHKPRISAVPPIALMALGAAMQDGCNKYGLFNWRDSSVTSTVFYDAIQRHLAAWYSGEDHAPDSGVHHLAHVMAGCAILLDAEFNGVNNDDRRDARHVVNDIESFYKKAPKCSK